MKHIGIIQMDWEGTMLASSVCLFLIFCCSVAQASTCLHNGCNLTSGLQADRLNEIIQANLKTSEFNENVLRVMSWNILHDEENQGEDSWKSRKQDLCEYLKKVEPNIFGLQEVMSHQLEFVAQCLPDYSFVGKPRSSDRGAHFNPIFFKNEITQSRIRVADSGTFWLSKTPNVPVSKLEQAEDPGIATWAKIWVWKLLRKESGFAKFFRDFANRLDGKTRSESRYKWEGFYFVNTHLNWKDVNVARQQIRILLTHMKSEVMYERKYPVILTGDLSWEDNTVLYEEIKNFNWLQNTMTNSRKTYPALTAVDLKTKKGKELIDYVWQSDFDSVLSATLTDLRPNGRFYSDHLPIFAALLL